MGDAERMDVFILASLKNRTAVTCPALANAWMAENNIRYTDAGYHYTLQLVNRHMKSLEKYGMVRYTGMTVSRSDRSKIWETI